MINLETRLRSALAVAADQIEVSPDGLAAASAPAPRQSFTAARAPALGLGCAGRRVRSSARDGCRRRHPRGPQQHPARRSSDPTRADGITQRGAATQQEVPVPLSRTASIRCPRRHPRSDGAASTQGCLRQIAVISTADRFEACSVGPDGAARVSGFLTWLGGRSNFLRYPVNHEYNTHPHPNDGRVPPADNYDLDLGTVASNAARVDYLRGGHPSPRPSATVSTSRATARGGIDGLRGTTRAAG